MMQAIVVNEYGPAEVLKFQTVPRPIPDRGDLLVRVHAVSINPVDFKIRSGLFARELFEKKEGRIIGYDAAGVVVQVGPDAGSKFKVGDHVYYAGNVARQGSYAQYQAVDHRIVGHKPKSLSFEQAAALPLTTLTAWEMLVEKMSIDRPTTREYNTIKEPPKQLLVIGAPGGVGSISVQVGRLFVSPVIGTATGSEATEWVKSMGADIIIDTEKGLQQELQRIGFNTIDYIYNCPGVDMKTINSIISPFGQDGEIAAPPVKIPEDIIPDLYFKAVTINYEMMFQRPLGPQAQRTGDILEHVSKLVDAGKIKSHQNPKFTWNWKEVVKAHKQIESGTTIGKIVLTVDQEEK